MAENFTDPSFAGGRPRAVCLLSGGMDSAACLAAAIADGYETHALSFDYGQRHRTELEASRRVAGALGAASHRVVRIDLDVIGGSALTAEIDVPKGRAEAEIGAESDGVPVTYVPARNTVFLSIALGLAETLGARDIYTGVNAVDYSGYPDCRPEFLQAFERLAEVATAAGAAGGRPFKVRAPLLHLGKAEIVTFAEDLGVDLGLTHTCYDPVEQPAGPPLSCGRCDACLLRLAGFRDAGREDPIPYAR